MPVILLHTEQLEQTALEIFVKYDPKQNIVLEIKSVFINCMLGMIPVGSLLISIAEMDVAINKIIDRVDWREKYKEMQESAKESA